MKFENLTVKNGLESNRVEDCFKDAKGFMWFITDNGLCRFDGRNIHVFSSRNSKQYGLTENIFSIAHQKSEDEILFVSDYGNLFSYRYSAGRFINVSRQTKFLQSRGITNLYRDRNKNYWFSTDNGLIKTDSNYNFIAEYIIKSASKDKTVRNTVLKICEDKKGIFWLGMLGRCVMRFDPAAGVFSQKELYGCLPKQQQVKSFSYAKNSDYIFVATGGEGLYMINIYNFSYKKWKYIKGDSNSLPSDRVTSICSQGDSILWIGTLDGLAKLNLSSQKITRYLHDPEKPYSLVNNRINSVYIDSQNILWVATFAGVGKLDTNPRRFIKVSQVSGPSNTLSNNRIAECLEDKHGNLWIATSNGIDVKEAKSGKYFHYDLPKNGTHHTNEEVIKFFVDGEVWWIGTWGGGLSRFMMPVNFKPEDNLHFVNFVSDSSDSRSLSSNFIRSFAKDSKGNLWISTWNGGLNKISFSQKQKDKITFERFFAGKDSTKSIASNYCDALFIDSYDQIWLGTSVGIQKIDFAKNKYEMLLPDTSNYSSLINTSIYFVEGSKNEIWSTNYGGLVKIECADNFRHTSKIIYYTDTRGIYNGIFDKNGKLWFATISSEIGKYDPQKCQLKFYSMYDEIDGFDFYFGKPTKNKDGRIYFTGNSGYLYFDPANVNENKFIPPVYITSLRIGSEELVPGCDISLLKEITLNYDQKNISIDFAALNYLSPGKNEYKYILEGFDKDWIVLGNKNQINITNLPAGEFRLKIIGSNNDGIWNYHAAVLSIRINPPLWQNIYFRLFLSLMLAACVYLYFNSKIKRLKKVKAQQDRFSKMLIESQEEERKRLSHELHDSLGQNLLVIKNQLDLYKISPIKNEQDLTVISDLVKESVSEVKEISSNLHPHQLERLGLKKAVIAMIEKISNSGNINIESQLGDIAGSIPKETEINIYRIIQESLNNILKHSGSSRARVEIKKEVGKILLIIEDYGKGLDMADATIQNKLNEGLGLKSIGERVRLLNGELQIESAPGKGTKILVTINTSK